MSLEEIIESLEIERTINAPIDRVFAAWTDAKLLASWFGPDNFEVIEAQADCKPKGKYSITLLSPDGHKIEHFGEYLEVDKPNKLIFTWVLENQACSGSSEQNAMTIVELDFSAHGKQTVLKLTHQKLPSRTSFDGHRFGWNASLNKLERLLNPTPEL